ncbi:WASH complex subunit 3 [Pieris brassicae]|uniref:WASH complex subunit 3 n=1 Tax=Pieris brassicae TaxID=7116 RepID=UPI001E65EC05|nr:WASH complex subunit 3 [Pieris brassicae]
MHDNLTSPVSGNIDYDSMAALQQKRTLAFVNHFILTTVQFLNNFAKQCEHKLMCYENKLEKINASLVLLETRLSSLPEISSPEPSLIKQQFETNSENTTQAEATTDAEEKTTDGGEKPTQTIKAEYMRFVKMVHVGVPIQAVKLKASLEGLDPNELDIILKI